MLGTSEFIESLKRSYNYSKTKMRSSNRVAVSLKNGDDVNFRSMFEFNIAVLLEYKNISFSYEKPEDVMLYFKQEKWDHRYEKFGLTKDDMNINHSLYFPDFKINNSNIYLEVKGHFSSVDRTKMILVQKHNPDKKILMVLQNPRAKATTKLLAFQWCEKHNIEWCSVTNVLEKIEELNK